MKRKDEQKFQLCHVNKTRRRLMIFLNLVQLQQKCTKTSLSLFKQNVHLVNSVYLRLLGIIKSIKGDCCRGNFFHFTYFLWVDNFFWALFDFIVKSQLVPLLPPWMLKLPAAFQHKFHNWGRFSPGEVIWTLWKFPTFLGLSEHVLLILGGTAKPVNLSWSYS